MPAGGLALAVAAAPGVKVRVRGLCGAFVTGGYI
jgi:hypothetical protein